MNTEQQPTRIEIAPLLREAPMTPEKQELEVWQAKVQLLLDEKQKRERAKAVEFFIQQWQHGKLERADIVLLVKKGILPDEAINPSFGDTLQYYLSLLNPVNIWALVAGNPKTTIKGAVKAAAILLALLGVTMTEQFQLVIVELIAGLWAAYEAGKGALSRDKETL